jgi:hypothetical protein
MTTSALKDANSLNGDNEKKLLTWDMLRMFVCFNITEYINSILVRGLM